MRTIYYITKLPPDLENFSRDLKESITILPLLEIQILLDFQILDKFQACDSLIFTSKNAIFALKKNLESLPNATETMRRWHNLPNFTLGSGCNETLKRLGLKSAFRASKAYGNEFAQELIPHLRGKKPLFVRAHKISSNFPQILENEGISLQQSILYETLPLQLKESQKKPLERDCVIFFSAPSHLRSFLLNYTWDSSFIALCIGKTTQKCALELLDKEAKILLSPEVSKKAALEFAKTL
ncbi:uroporphyrinogen-III synthase [uncultured Helicobacter sp.]|uniref:uroporphyrinogen-III synthase n=1 Tax=uncultured Helicobacter sp. TaxID=175537 RepID=UPI0026035CEB|nr:uroporphyrinogen-III synthase [uncultured Helicobacter sp.]